MCAAIRFVYFFITICIYVYICRIKFVAILHRMTSYLFEFEFPPKFEFPRSQGGAGARTALLVGGVAEAAPSIPALYSGV